MTIAFTTDDWRRIRETYAAWWDGTLDRPLVHLPNVFEPSERVDGGFRGYLAAAPPGMTGAALAEAIERNFAGQRFPGDTFPMVFVNFGAGSLAAYLGARVNVRPETVWFEPPEGADLATLEIAPRPAGYWWDRTVEFTTALVERFGDVAQVSIADLGGNLDVLASLVGTEALLADLIDRPEAVDEAVRRVNRCWLDAYDRLWGIIRRRCPGCVAWAPTWAPGRHYMLQSDFAYMISPPMFERFVLPDLRACCERLDYAFYHLDGVGQLAHVDHLLSLERLRGIQWIPGDGKPHAEHWLDLLRRIRDAGRRVQVYVTGEGAKALCRTIGGRGILLSVWDRMTPDQAETLYEQILTAGR